MYYSVTHGWGTDPDKYLTTEYWKLKTARKVMYRIFDMYQTALENGKEPASSFTCILKAKGVNDSGTDKKAATR